MLCVITFGALRDHCWYLAWTPCGDALPTRPRTIKQNKHTTANSTRGADGPRPRSKQLLELSSLVVALGDSVDDMLDSALDLVTRSVGRVSGYPVRCSASIALRSVRSHNQP